MSAPYSYDDKQQPPYPTGAPSYPAYPPVGGPGYPAAQNTGYPAYPPPQQGFPAYPPPQQGFPGAPQQPTVGFVNPMPQPGFPPQDPNYGGYQQPGFPPQSGYQQPGFPPQSGYQQPGPAYPQPGYPDTQPGGKPLNPPYMDEGDPNFKPFGGTFDDKVIRAGFIRRVYSILSIQLLVTLGFVALMCLHVPTQKFVAANSWLMIVAMVLTIVIICAISCCETARRTSPTNMILLSAFTICESFLVGAISSSYKVNEVMLAIGLTTVIVIALTAFAFQTSVDFTMCGGFMCVLMVLLVGAGIVGIFWRNNFFHFLMACGGALIFSMYIVYDTQMMMGGSHKYSISPEEYVFAALNLYLDIINLFIYLLRIIKYLNND